MTNIDIIPPINKAANITTKIPPQVVKSDLVKIAYKVRATTIPAVSAAAIKTVDESYYVVIKATKYDSHTVKTNNSIKLIGTDQYTDL